MNVLSIVDLVAGYGDSRVLNGVSVDVRQGEVVSIVGPNGAGKSTLLKAIVGLVRPHTGTVVFEGADITGARTEDIIQAGIGYVPQVSNVFPSLSVRENLALMFPRRTKRAVVSDGIEMVLKAFPVLASRLRSRAATLSGGERQMLALARALVTQPRLLLLDEPTAAVAPMLVDAIFSKISEINAEQALPIVLVEQNAKKALSVSNRAYVLESGREALSGPAAELLANPDVEHLYLGGSTQATEGEEEVVRAIGSHGDSMPDVQPEPSGDAQAARTGSGSERGTEAARADSGAGLPRMEAERL